MAAGQRYERIAVFEPVSEEVIVNSGYVKEGRS